MFWVPIAAWGFAVLVCLVVLGFCAYELIWKTRRLQRDLVALQAMADDLAVLRREVTAAQQRLAASGLR